MSTEAKAGGTRPILVLALLFLMTVVIVAVNEHHIEVNNAMVDHYASYDQDLAERITALEDKVAKLEGTGPTASINP